MIPEAAYAMLACARIGAVHSVVFAGFSAEALRSRLEDSGAKLLVTADEAPRGGRRTPLKANADKATAELSGLRQLVVRRTGARCPGTPAATSGCDEAAAGVAADCPPEAMAAEDPLFILYTSGSHRQAQGGAAHLRRLPALRRDDAPATSSTTTTATSTGARPTSAG